MCSTWLLIRLPLITDDEEVVVLDPRSHEWW